MREDLIKILANIGGDYVGTIDKLEEYIDRKIKESFWTGAESRNEEYQIQTIEESYNEYKKQTNNK